MGSVQTSKILRAFADYLCVPAAWDFGIFRKGLQCKSSVQTAPFRPACSYTATQALIPSFRPSTSSSSRVCRFTDFTVMKTLLERSFILGLHSKVPIVSPFPKPRVNCWRLLTCQSHPIAANRNYVGKLFRLGRKPGHFHNHPEKKLEFVTLMWHLGS